MRAVTRAFHDHTDTCMYLTVLTQFRQSDTSWLKMKYFHNRDVTPRKIPFSLIPVLNISSHNTAENLSKYKLGSHKAISTVKAVSHAYLYTDSTLPHDTHTATHCIIHYNNSYGHWGEIRECCLSRSLFTPSHSCFLSAMNSYRCWTRHK